MERWARKLAVMTVPAATARSRRTRIARDDANNDIFTLSRPRVSDVRDSHLGGVFNISINEIGTLGPLTAGMARVARNY